MSANAAKSGKSVSPKVRQKGENAAGGLFDQAQDRLFSTFPIFDLLWFLNEYDEQEMY